MGMIVAVAALPAAPRVRVIVGVCHGLVNMGRGRGRDPGGSGLVRGSGVAVEHTPYFTAGRHERGEPNPTYMLQITVWLSRLGTGCPGRTVTDDVS